MCAHLRPNRPWGLNNKTNIRATKAMESRGSINASGDVTRNVSTRPKMRDAINRPPDVTEAAHDCDGHCLICGY
jgi:hypothetical protein